MTESYRALCSDFYVNQKLSVKLDLPQGRETTLDLFERVRKTFPSMSSFRRYQGELALESSQADMPHRWVAVRPGNVRSGVVNPGGPDDAYGLHRTVLEVAPFFLSISPLDIEYVELLYGFDFHAPGNQDQIVAEALLADSPLAGMFDIPGIMPLEFQPLVGFVITDEDEPLASEPASDEDDARLMAGTEVHVEVKTRSGLARDAEGHGEPISLYVTLRRYEPVRDLEGLPRALAQLASRGQALIEDRVIPQLVRPLRDAIAGSGL